MPKTMVVFILLINTYIYFKRTFLSGRYFFIYISNDLSNAFGTDICVGFWTNFFTLITTTLVSCVSDMLRSWWLQKTVKQTEIKSNFKRSSV